MTEVRAMLESVIYPATVLAGQPASGQTASKTIIGVSIIADSAALRSDDLILQSFFVPVVVILNFQPHGIDHGK